MANAEEILKYFEELAASTRTSSIEELSITIVLGNGESFAQAMDAHFKKRGFKRVRAVVIDNGRNRNKDK